MHETPEKQRFFSIVTVTKDNLSGLVKTQKSIEKQTLKDFEWIVIDGASGDGTPEHLKTLDCQWVSENDGGIYHAMNKGIERANGRYILFLNAGDTLANSTVLATAQAAATENPALIYGDAIEAGAYKPARKPNIARGMFTHHQSMFFHRNTVGNLRYNTAYKIAADYEFLARFLMAGETLAYVQMPICIFEQGGVSQTRAHAGRREQFQIRKKLKLSGAFQNYVITTAQAALWKFRTLAPALYWRLKSSGNTVPVNTQTDTPPPRPANPA